MSTTKGLLTLSELRQGDLVRFHDLGDGYFSWASIADGRMAHVTKCILGTFDTWGRLTIEWTYSTAADTMPPELVYSLGRDGRTYPSGACWELCSRICPPEEAVVSPPAAEPVGRLLDRRPQPSQPKETYMPGFKIGVFDVGSTEHLFKDKAAYQSFVGELAGAVKLQPEVVLMADGQPVAMLLSPERMAAYLTTELTAYLGNPAFVRQLNELFSQYTRP